MRKTLLITLFLLCLFGVARAQFFNSASKMNVPALESGTLIFSDNFDAGNLDNWVTIDADGDGHTWVHSSTPEDYLVNDADISGWGHNSSEGFVISGSYSNSNGGVLHPDNYLVTKEKVALGGTLVFWSCTQDSDFPYEHFGVAVSTTSNSDASTFTMLQEWTMTSAPGMKLSPGKKALRAPKQEQGNWYQYIVDLSAYAGQEGYVAFRHFYCSDQFILNIDDVEIYDGTPNVAVIPTNVTVSEITENSVKVSWDGAGDSFNLRYRPAQSAYAGQETYISIRHSAPRMEGAEWTTLEVTEATAELTALTPKTTYEVQVQGITDGNASEWCDVVTFTTLAATPVEAPTDLAISDITAESAVATWSGSNDSYNIRYREVATTTSDVATVILSVDDVWGDGSGYQMLLDADANAFGSVIPETGALTAGGDVDESIYAEFEYKIPENADGALSTANMLVDASAQIEIPAGTYDWCITNPTPGDRMWIASAGGTVGGRADDYVFEGGKTYEFHVYLGSPNDKTDLTVTGAPAGEWTTVEGVASPYSLTGLTAEATYEVQVQGITGGNASEWTSSVTFTTSEATGINGLKIAGQENWYTIDGRKLAKRPTTAGVYILNRSKVIIK
ncbi:MAG: DUF2436 domain-containing protein [Prevotella sp.]|nr:DUF2436 domain-containing protein [Prevotella sp.]